MSARAVVLALALGATMPGTALGIPAAVLARGPVRAIKFGSDVAHSHAPRGGTVTTFGGDVHFGSVGGPLRALTFGGDVALDTLVSSARITTFGGQVRAYLGAETAAEKRVTIRTYGGDVRLELAPEVDATIEIEQVCRRGESHEVHSDVPLEESIGPWKRRLFRGDRRTIRSTAKIGDGGDVRVRVRVEGGDVSLVRDAIVAHR